MAPVENNDPSKAKQRTAKASTQAVQNVKAGFYTGSEDKAAWAAFDKIPYPNAPHDGGPQDLANQKANIAAQNNYQGYEAALQAQRDNGTFMDKFGPMIALTMATAGAGMGVGGAVSDLTGSAIAGGAAGGATTGALGSALQGQSLGTIGKSTLMGGLGGGLGAAAAPGASALGSSTGLSPALSSGIVRGAIGAGTGALAGGGAGALMGGAGGFLSGAIGGATGSNLLGKVAAGVGGAALGRVLSSGTSHGGATQSGGTNFIGAGAPGGQGNNGNMASTDSTLAQTITGVLPGVLQGAAGVYGSQNAAEKQTQADQNAIGTQTSTLGNINSIWGTQQNLGQGAQTALGSALGTNGKPADYSGFENMPGYQFAQQQGTQAIQRQAAAMGSAYTPNTAAAVGQYVTGTAMQDYNTYIGQLMGAAGLGSTANQNLQTGTQTVGNNISQLQQNQGQAQASGVSGASNAIGGLFGPNGVGTGLIGAAGKYLGGGGGSSGGGIGTPAGGGNLYQGPLGNDTSTGVGNGNFGSGVDPTTGQAWTNGGMAEFTDPGYVPTLPSIDTSGDFGGSLDYGSSSNDLFSGGTDFMGGF